MQMEAEIFGWREVILLLVGLAVLYLVVTVIRLLRVGKRSHESGKQEPPLAETVIPAPAPLPELTEAVSTLAVSRSNEWNDVIDLELLGGTEPVPESAAETPLRVSGFGEQLAEHLARSDLEREVRLLRKEVDELRAELEELRAVRNISPHYAEAVALAQRGLTAQDVADRMGISLAEAELVYALSRGESIFEEGEHDGSDRDDGETGDGGRDRYEPGFGFDPHRNG
jgi:DNA-directed RNA polymerase specialized sigma24 family protein